MRSKFTTVPVGQPQVPEDAFLPQNQYFHTNSWKNGFDVSDAPEDSEPGSSFVMEDVEVTEDDHLIRAPGVTPTDVLAHTPTQIFLHAGFQFASDMILLAPPYFGVKNASGVQWFDAGLQAAAPYGHTNFAGVLLLTNGSKGIYYREPNKLTLNLIDKSVAGFGLAVFAGRVVVGGAQLDGKLDFMGVAWNDSSGDYKGWDPALGAGGQSMIGTSDFADRFQGFAALGFDTLVVINRRSIWIGVQTGDEFQPIRFSERLKNIGCAKAATIQATEYGVLFLADDGVRMFTGNDAPVISLGINRVLGPIRDSDVWTSSFDPFRKRYYLHGPTGTWIYDLKMRRWFHWLGSFSGSVFFPTQGTQITWGQAVGTWGSQTLAWWQLLPQESGGAMHFTQGTNLGVEDATSASIFGVALNSRWFDRVQVADNQDVLMTALGARFTYEGESPSDIEVWLPDKPDGNYEFVTAATLPPPTAFTKRAWVPFIHTGRSIGLGLRILNGFPRIRRASVEFQPTSLPWELEDTLASGGGGQSVVSGAMLRPRPVWSNGYETDGQVYRTGSQTGAGVALRGIGGEITGDFVRVASGGRDDGGYVTTLASDEPGSGLPADRVGNYQYVALGRTDDAVDATLEPARRGLSQHHAFNFFGAALPFPVNLVGFDNNGVDAPNCLICIQISNVDRKARVMKVGRNLDGTATFTQLGPDGIAVPATGWFAIEPQAYGAPQGNTAGGFCVARLYTEDGPDEGVDLVRAVGADIELFDGWHGYLFGSEVVRGNTVGVTGIGVDDSVLANDQGDAIRWLGNCFVGAAIPSAAGDETQSVIDWSRLWSDWGTPPETIGAAGTHGSADRWRNVTQAPARSASEVLVGTWWFGQISEFTSIWMFAPAYPLESHPIQYGEIRSDVAAAWNTAAFAAIAAIQRNTIFDENGDLYRVSIDRNGIAELEGLFPWARTSFLTVDGFHGIGPASDNGDGTFSPAFTSVALRPVAGPYLSGADATIYGGLDQPRQHSFRLRIKSRGVEAVLPVVYGHRGPGGWQTIPGYLYTGPDGYLFVATNPATGTRFDPADLPLIQVGLKGDLSHFDALHPDALSDVRGRWAQIDVIEVGFDFVYHRSLVTWAPPGPMTPVAGFFFVAGTDFPARHVLIQDASVDYDGSVTSRVVDWGDGSPTEAITEGGQLTHDYAAPGTYNITLTATDNDGLVGTVTHSAPCFVVNEAPVANFDWSAAGLTVTFNDLSTDDVGIVSRDWDFGDGSPHSTDQNPVHTYAGVGTYPVTLVVTDGGGEASQPPLSDSQEHDVDAALAGPSRVNMPILWADSMAAGLNQSKERYDFTGGSEAIVAGGGRNGKDAIKEGGTFGTWQYTFRSADPRAFQFGFDFAGQALPAKELPLFMIGNENVAVVLRPDGKVRVYALDASFVWQQVLETAAAVPTSGPVVGQIRFKYGSATTGFVDLWINGETLSADPVAVNPGGSLTMVGDTITFGTGSAGNYNYAPAGGFDTGKADTVWFDIAAMDDSPATTNGDTPGDVNFAICTPQAIGAFNDTGLTAASDLQSDDHATTQTSFTATNQKDTLTVNSPTLVGTPTILSVLPYYEGIRGGTVGTKTLALLCKSGATLAQSPSFSASSSWTSRFHVIPADTIDKWVLTNDPATAAAWANAAAVGGSEVGAIAVSLNAGGTWALSQLGYEVLYWNV